MFVRFHGISHRFLTIRLLLLKLLAKFVIWKAIGRKELVEIQSTMQSELLQKMPITPDVLFIPARQTNGIHQKNL
ncbi:hypothetical protein D3C87_1965110 [compost metagenome]